MYCSPHCSGSRSVATVRALSQVFCTRPRSEQRVLGALQGHRRSWFVRLCPFQVQATQVTGCLVSALSQLEYHVSYHLPGPGRSVAIPPRHSPQVCCVSPHGELISGLGHSWRCQPSRIPGDMVSNWQPAQFGGRCGLWRWCSGPCLPALHLCLPGGRALNGSWLVLLLWYLLRHKPLFYGVCQEVTIRSQNL